MVYLALIVWLNIALHSMDIIVQIFLFRTYKELIAGQMEECILVSGEIIKCTEKGYLLGVMEESIYFNF